MPVLYIREVNTRLSYKYRKYLTAYNGLLQRFILKPLITTQLSRAIGNFGLRRHLVIQRW